MLEQLTDLPAGTLGFSGHGTVTAADYEDVFVPDVEAAFAMNRKLRLLYFLGPDFKGFEAGAMWDDTKLGFRHLSGWERIALVTDVGWIRMMAHAFGFTVPGQFKLFHNNQLDEARQWIASV